MKVCFRSLLTAGLFILPLLVTSQDLNPGFSITPLPFYDDYEDGYFLLRDGSKIEGKIDLKKYEKDGSKITITTADGEKRKFNIYALNHFALNIDVPHNHSPLAYYDWKNEKRKETKDAERGFAILKSGETLDGKIRVEGQSSESELAGENFFAIEKLYFTDNTGKETAYTREQLKGYGRILPWELSPAEMYQWQGGEAMGKKKTKHQPGFLIMSDGKKVEGEMQLVVKNKLTRTKGSSGGSMMGGSGMSIGASPEPVKSKIHSDMVDEIYFKRDGKNDKISLDDVFAFGLSNMTINTLTNKGSISYPIEEMNFHEGTVITKDGKEMQGYLAYRPKPSAYYGVYFATNRDEPITIIPTADIKDVQQNISLIEAFDDGSAPAEPKPNTNINGYIIKLDGSRFNGTVKIVDDNDWWVKGMEFTDKDGNVLSLGGENPPISCFVTNNTTYIQHENIFVKGETMATPLTIYSDPYPPKVSKFGKAMINMAASQLAADLSASVSSRVLAAQIRSDINMAGTTVNGRDMGGLNAAYFVGNMASDALMTGINKLMEGKRDFPVQGTRRDEYFLYDVKTAENPSVTSIEHFLEGCLDFHALSKDEQKALLDKKDYKAAVEYINKCYTKNSK